MNTKSPLLSSLAVWRCKHGHVPNHYTYFTGSQFMCLYRVPSLYINLQLIIFWNSDILYGVLHVYSPMSVNFKVPSAISPFPFQISPYCPLSRVLKPLASSSVPTPQELQEIHLLFSKFHHHHHLPLYR